MSSIPSYFLEPLLLRLKSCLLFLTEKSYKGFKIVKILKKKDPLLNMLCPELEPEQQENSYQIQLMP